MHQSSIAPHGGSERLSTALYPMENAQWLKRTPSRCPALPYPPATWPGPPSHMWLYGPRGTPSAATHDLCERRPLRQPISSRERLKLVRAPRLTGYSIKSHE
jgi:hypothetical protein